MPEPVILALDFETANYDAHSACQIGVVRIENWQVSKSQAWLIKPPSDDFVFTYLHEISWNDVAGEADWAKLWPELKPWFDGADYLAAHNAPFDRGVLQAACNHYGINAPATRFLDTVSIARKVWNIFPTKLNLVCEKLKIELNHHEALSDAKACAEILIQARATGWTP